MKVLIIDDSAVMRAILRQALESENVEIVGEGRDGQVAIELCQQHAPDVVIMDFNMPIMNGTDATREIMKTRPTPILLFSSEVDAQLSFDALQAGAAEVMAKPDLDQFNDQAFRGRLVATLKALAGSPRRWRAGGMQNPGGDGAPVATGKRSFSQTTKPYSAVVIGASTGGPVAVRELLSSLPADFPLGIAVVQHIEARFAERFAQWLDSGSRLTVRLAQERDAFRPGTVLVAPGDRHLICRDRQLYLDDGPKVLNQRPAVDRLFQTTVGCYGEGLIGVLLTGMGADGADGCVQIKGAGGLTLVQDESSSVIFGMPRVAIERDGAVRVLPLKDMARVLLEAVGRHE